MAACAAASLMRPFFTRLARLAWMRPRPACRWQGSSEGGDVGQAGSGYVAGCGGLQSYEGFCRGGPCSLSNPPLTSRNFWLISFSSTSMPLRTQAVAMPLPIRPPGKEGAGTPTGAGASWLWQGGLAQCTVRAKAKQSGARHSMQHLTAASELLGSSPMGAVLAILCEGHRHLHVHCGHPASPPSTATRLMGRGFSPASVTPVQ